MAALGWSGQLVDPTTKHNPSKQMMVMEGPADVPKGVGVTGRDVRTVAEPSTTT